MAMDVENKYKLYEYGLKKSHSAKTDSKSHNDRCVCLEKHHTCTKFSCVLDFLLKHSKNRLE